MNLTRILAGALVGLGTLFPADALAHGAHSVTGVLVERHGDRFDGAKNPSTYRVSHPGGSVPLSGSQPAHLVGSKVTVVDGDTVKPGVQGRARSAGPPPGAAEVAGSLATLVILVSTPDAAQAISPDQARDAVFTGGASASALFASQSGGATRLTGVVRGDGDVAGPFGLAVYGSGCNYDVLADAGDAAASSAGWAPASYQHVLYVLPRLPDCNWGGLGEMPGRRSWTNGYMHTGVIAHEIGHNRGVHHANSYRCTDSNGAAVTLSASCSSNEYGDPFDVMGLSTHLMSSFHRAQVGDLPESQRTLVTEAGTYPVDAGGDGDRLVLVPRKTPGQAVTEWYALESRSASLPFDDFEPGSPVTTGVTVRLVPALNRSLQTWLLDMTPSTYSLDDAMLQPGSSFTDPSLPITIAVDASGDAVSVSMPKLVDDVPPSINGTPWGYVSNGSVTLNWSAATDDTGLAQYEVERSGAVVATTKGTSFKETVAGPTTVTYRVIAVDTSGNRAATGTVAFTIPRPPGGAGGGSSTGGGSPDWDAEDYHYAALGAIRRLSDRVRRGRGGWIITMRFTCRNAARMTATLNGRRVRTTYSGRLTVRFRFPYGAKRRRLRIRAWNDSSTASATWTWTWSR